MDKNEASEWASKITETYNYYSDDYEVKPVENGGVIGFYLFTNGFREGNLLCSEDTVAAFYEVKNSDAANKEKFYKLFRDEAICSYGFEATADDPDALTWREIKEYVNSLTDKQLDEEFLAFEDNEATELRAIGINRYTNSLIVR